MKTKIFCILCLSFLILTEVLKAQEGWFTLFSEYAVTTTYTGLQFLNGDTGYMTASWGNEHNNGGYTSKTTNGGYNWFSVDWSVAKYGLFFLNEQTGWTFGGYWDDAGKKSREVFKTTNGGVSFQRVFIDSLQQSFRRMYFADVNTGWVTTFSDIIKSTNSGTNWFTCANISMNSIFFADANSGWGVTSTGIIYKTTNGGLNWFSQATVSGNAFADITFINPNTGWACGTPPNIFKTTNAGTNWIAYGTGFTVLVSSVKFTDLMNGWACSNAGEIFHTSNGGINWVPQNSGVNFILYRLSFPNQLTGYVLGDSFSTPYNHDNILLKTTSGGTVFVQKISTEVPKSFSLSQNYPNPFNPSTRIKFDIPLSRGVSGGRGVSVKLIIYDILGREVATLVNEQLQPGTYEVEWDGTDYPSGVYFYKLTTDEFTETKKMVLIK
jgi:photosystem II stability/assembly factor-like uncharacterized protein